MVSSIKKVADMTITDAVNDVKSHTIAMDTGNVIDIEPLSRFYTARSLTLLGAGGADSAPPTGFFCITSYTIKLQS